MNCHRNDHKNGLIKNDYLLSHRVDTLYNTSNTTAPVLNHGLRMTGRTRIHQAVYVLCFIFICFSLIFSQQVLAARELSFCPAGGPTGWLNHFNYKRDQNILKLHQRNYPGRPFPYRMKPPHHRYYPFYARYFQPLIQHNNAPYGNQNDRSR